MKKIMTVVLISFFFFAAAQAAVVSEPIDYSESGQTLQGVLYYDDAIETLRPGVIVMHEWKGLGDYAKKRAEILAELGYVAFAADMYGKDVFAESHEQAAELSGIYFKDRVRMRERARAAYEALLLTGKVDSSHIAAIGYCFGGATVLEMARSGLPIKGVASFHGILTTSAPAEKGSVLAAVIVFNGADDAMNKAEDIQAFQDEMRAAGADWQFVNLGGAKHSFTVWDANMPEKGIEYNEAADKRSWAMLKDFLKEIFHD